ncbi:MAG TPA: carbon-nitrogen hydrolase family protein [Gemmatimonadaceae bacterium]|nr:carbon-nitrogen hydrolase family protein [Gemmatimonadaceae bacterium]
MTTHSLAVCEAPPELDPGGAEWSALASRFRAARADVALLDEMPFGRWIAAGSEPDPLILERSSSVHDAGIARLDELGAPVVLGTRPVVAGGAALNEGFAWERGRGATPVHTKQFFPEEDGYWEARWFARGETHFRLADCGGLKVGFLICTEVMFNEWARHYGRLGADLIVVPRVTPRQSTRRWRTAVSMAAIVSGCWVASSNRGGTDSLGQEFGGAGWIVDPYGDVVAETSAAEPVIAATMDLSRARAAQREYPCYVRELNAGGVLV